MDHHIAQFAALTRRTSRRLGIALVVMVVLFTVVMGQTHVVATPNTYDWLQFDGDAQHSGNNTLETTLNAANVGNLHLLFQVPLHATAPADGEPMYLGGVNTSSGTRDLLFITDMDGSLLALDAHTGTRIWDRQPLTGTCVDSEGKACVTRSSPAITPDRQHIVSYSLDGRVHEYSVGNGQEVTSGGWPELVTLKPQYEKVSPALSVATDAQTNATYLYVTTSSFDDLADYQGHLTTINLSNGGTSHVFNSLCSDQVDVHFVITPGSPDCPDRQSGMWAPASSVYDAQMNRIFVLTGNGRFDPANHDWGESVLELNPDGTGSGDTPLDSYTPANYQNLSARDLDLNSGGLSILPVPSSSNIKHLGVIVGKDGLLRLLNLDNLSGQGGPGHTGGEISTLPVPQGGPVGLVIENQPAVWINPTDHTTWLFVSNSFGVAGLQLAVNSSGVPSLQSRWVSTAISSTASPLVAAGVLYGASDNNMYAVDPTSGNVLWHDTSIGPMHTQSPVVANGILYILDKQGRLTAYTISSAGSPTATSTIPPSLTPTLPPTATPTPSPTTTSPASPTAPPTVIPTVTPTASSTATSAGMSPTPSPTTPPTGIPTTTPTASVTPSSTVAPTMSPIATVAGTPTATAMSAATSTPTTPPVTGGGSGGLTGGNIVIPPATSTAVPTVSSTPTATPTSTGTATATATATSTPTPLVSCTVTANAVPSNTPGHASTNPVTVIPTPATTLTPGPAPCQTNTPTADATPVNPPTIEPSGTPIYPIIRIVTKPRPAASRTALLVLALPLSITGRPAQATIVGGRKMPCPAISILRRIIAQNTAHHKKDRFAAPYPPGCLWVPIHVSHPTLAARFRGATVIVTVRFPNRSMVVVRNKLDKDGSVTFVIALPYLPPPHAAHGSPPTIASLTAVVTGQNHKVLETITDRFVIIRSA